MPIISSLNRQCSNAVDKILESPKVQRMLESKVGRVALYALAGLTIAAGVVAGCAGLAGIMVAKAHCPILGTVLLVLSVSSVVFGVSSFICDDAATKRKLLSTSSDIFAVMYLPVLPGYALAKGGFEAIQRIRHPRPEVAM